MTTDTVYNVLQNGSYVSERNKSSNTRCKNTHHKPHENVTRYIYFKTERLTIEAHLARCASVAV